jgi:hypothetical protein
MKEEVKNFIEKLDSFKTSNKVDLSSKEDLGIAVMNLISIEEHLFFTYGKTNDKKSLELLNKIREMRKKYLAEIVKDPKGEIWCISKHLLAGSMRLMEVGTKMLNDKNTEKAKELFNGAYDLWNMFWGLNLNLINIKDVQAENDKEINLEKGKKVSIFDGLGKILKKILNCCKE